jgi:hypothetical protein
MYRKPRGTAKGKFAKAAEYLGAAVKLFNDYG